MADTKTTALTALTLADKADLFYIVDGPTVGKKITGANALGGWIGVSDSWVYASETTITVPSGAASFYTVGDKLEMTNSGTKHNYVISVADTVLTVVGDGVANAAITSPKYSKGSNPLSFPVYFDFTPTGANFTAGSATIIGKYMQIGKTVRGYVDITMAGDSSVDNTLSLSLPSTPVEASQTPIARATYQDVGTSSFYGMGYPSTNNVVFRALNAAGTYTTHVTVNATVPFTWAGANADKILYTFEYAVA